MNENAPDSTSRAATALALAVTAVLGFCLRTANAASVFVAGRIVFPENDPYYHMRRVQQIVADYPRVPLFDPWLDYPHGAPVIFPPLFDLAVASLCRALGLDARSPGSVELVAALAIPLLGALTCIPVYRLARVAVGRRPALLAAMLVALVPAHVWYSRLGFVDHHAAVTFLQVAMLGSFAASFARLRTAPTARLDAAAVARVAAGALWIASGLLVWQGFLLFVAVLDAVLLAELLRSDPARRRAAARLLAGSHLGAALLLLPVVAATVRATGWPMSSRALSYLDVAALVAAGSLAPLVAGLRAGGASTTRRRVRWALPVLVAVGLAVLGGRAIGEGLRWIFASDDFMQSVQEAVPLLRGPSGGLDLEGPQIWMTRFFLAAPLLLGALAVRVWRERASDTGRLLLLLWATGLFCLTLLQRRFGEAFAPALAILVAWAVGEAIAIGRSRLGASGADGRLVRVLPPAIAAAVVGFALWPYYGALLADPARLAALFEVAPSLAASDPRGGGAATAESAADDEDAREFAALRRFRALLDRSPAGAPGDEAAVLGPWPLGHKLLYVARVPVVSTPFGSQIGADSFADSARFFLETDAARALELLRARRVKYVAVDGNLAVIGSAIVARGEDPRAYYGKERGADGTLRYSPEALLARTLFFRLGRLTGSEATLAAGDAEREERIPAVPWLRLVLDGADDDPSAIKVYQLVPGARLKLRAEPGRPVRARYAFETDRGRRVYESTATAGVDGWATIVVPYSSERPDLGQTGPYELTDASGRHETASVPEAAVQSGGAVWVDPPAGDLAQAE